jgi:tRNA-Thr(GGU) m(6)t(6)A37 methyltransferase TsaA
MYKPIGYFRSRTNSKADVPRQGAVAQGNEGVITLHPHCNYEQALEGLEDFERIWILFQFHLISSWKPKVLPPRSSKKRGVFATRSPHRPNPIGLSCVELIAIDGLSVYVKNHDLLDGTPILDIKPYLNYADSFFVQAQGWVDELSAEPFTIHWSVQALRQEEYLALHGVNDLKTRVERSLFAGVKPSASNRIRHIEDQLYSLSVKTWRLIFELKETEATILSIVSGYNSDTLAGINPSRWLDVPLHQSYLKKDFT